MGKTSAVKLAMNTSTVKAKMKNTKSLNQESEAVKIKKAYHQHEENVYVLTKATQAAFKKMDSNMDSKISIEEVAAPLSRSETQGQMDYQKSLASAKSVFEEVDEDGDDFLNAE